MTPSKQIGQALLQRGAIDEQALEVALEEEARTGTPLPALLARGGAVAEKDLVAAIAESVGLRFVDVAGTLLHPEAAEAIPALVARQHLCLGVEHSADGLVVAFADPTNTEALEAVKQAVGGDIVPAAAVKGDLEKAIDGVYGASGNGSGNGSTEAVEVASAPPLVEVDVPDEPAEAAAPPASSASADRTADPGSVVHLDDLLERVLDLGGSDLHLTVGIPPAVRVHGELKRLTEFPELTSQQIREMIYAVLSQKHREEFENGLELDTSYAIPGKARFRMNVFMQRESIAAVMRAIPFEIVDFDTLKLPESVKSFAQLTRGLVLVTGPTGSGKSTTLASLIDIINRERSDHIMTVEDPIEFLHQHKQCVVNQREVGEDTHSFAEALKRVLRQDPDVILVGEMRDLETIGTALTAAETGHLVFGTLHTQDAPQSIDRVIDVFPSHQQEQVRVQLAGALQGVVTQQLVPTSDGKGRAVAAEVLVITPAMRNLIREAKVHQIYSLMQSGGQHGMVTMDQSLALLVKQGRITFEMALERCHDQSELRRLAGRA